jgi:N-methylhydantoinase B
LYLHRRFSQDSGGPGEFRGGVGHEFAITPVADDDFEFMDIVSCGRGIRTPHSTGVFGGYPGANIQYTKHAQARPLDGSESFPPTGDELGEPEYIQWGVNGLADGDVFGVQFPGSGGYGDPLHRDPDAVAEDVRAGKIAPETAQQVYGVPVDEDGAIDGSVEEARDRIRAERLDAARLPEGDTPEVATEPTSYRLGADVVVEAGADGHSYAVCERCESIVGRADEHWKTDTAVVERPVSAVGTRTHAPDPYCLREFCCPDCAVVLDTEVAKSTDDPLVGRLSL